MAEVILDAVHKTFPRPGGGSIQALRGVSLTVRHGECVVLVGPSGCGKSTTLRLIAGLEQVTSGSIRIGGRDAGNLQPKDRDVAMVFQNYALYPHMTVRENLAFGLKLRRLRGPEIVQRISYVSETLGIGDILDRLPETISGGQRQRVALGRAIARRPGVLLLDEPLSNLDEPMRSRMRMTLSQLPRELAIIHVTHDQAEAMTLGERLVVMREGRLHQCAAPRSIYHEPSDLFVAGFFGSPPMNCFNGTIARRVSDGGMEFVEEARDGVGFRIPLRETQVGALALHVGRRVVLGLRPEALELREAASTVEGAFQAFLERVEWLGSESRIYFSTAGHAGIARGGTNFEFSGERESVRVLPDLSRARWFDRETTLAIPG